MSFCTACGRAATGHAFCTSCGEPVEGSARSAAGAGAAAAEPAPVSLPPSAQPAPWAGDHGPAGRRRSPLTLALVGLTVVLVGVAAVLLFLRFDDPPSVVAAPTPGATSERSDAPQEPTPTPTREPVETPGPSLEPVPTAPPPPPPDVTLPRTPFQVVVLASKTEAEGGRAAVEPLAAEVEAAGYPALVFASQDYSSLNCCYWVAAAGPFPDAASAASAATAMRSLSSSFGTAYPRCVGQATQCR